jgi:hypothetical protein
MRHELLPIILTVALAQTACETPIRAQHEYDPNVQFQDLATFAWVTDEPLLHAPAGVSNQDPRVNPLLESLIRASVERSLRAKGYAQRDDPASADLVVSFSVGTREQIRVDSYAGRGGYAYSRGTTWSGSVRQYTEGTLAIDFFDARTKQAVWHGWAIQRLRREPDSETRQANIDRAVDTILERFPYHN